VLLILELYKNEFETIGSIMIECAIVDNKHSTKLSKVTKSQQKRHKFEGILEANEKNIENTRKAIANEQEEKPPSPACALLISWDKSDVSGLVGGLVSSVKKAIRERGNHWEVEKFQIPPWSDVGAMVEKSVRELHLSVEQYGYSKLIVYYAGHGGYDRNTGFFLARYAILSIRPHSI